MTNKVKQANSKKSCCTTFLFVFDVANKTNNNYGQKLLRVNEKSKPCVRVCVRVYVKKKGYVDIIKSSQTTTKI